MWGNGVYLKPDLLPPKARLGWMVNLFLLSSMEEMLMTSWPELGQELNR